MRMRKDVAEDPVFGGLALARPSLADRVRSCSEGPMIILPKMEALGTDLLSGDE